MLNKRITPTIIIGLTIIPIFICSAIYTFSEIQNDGKQDAINNNMLVASSIQTQIVNTIENDFEALELVAKYPQVQTFESETLDPILDDVTSIFKTLKPIGIADESGMQVAKSDGVKKVDIHDRDHFIAAMNGQKRYISNVLTSRADGSYICIMAVPVIAPASGKPNGVVVGTLYTSIFSEFITSSDIEGAEYVEKNTTCFIIDSEGYLLAHPSVDFEVGEQRPSYNDYDFVKDGLAGNSDTVTYIDENGESILVSYIIEPHTGWIICSKVPLRVAQNDLKRKLTIISLLYIALIAILVLIIIILSLNIRKRKLAERKLSSLNDSLEEKVERRGKELEATVKEFMNRERLASLGSLVAGVAHEINTPLGVSVSAGSHLEQINNKAIENIANGKFSKSEFVEYMEQVNETVGIINANTYRASELINSFKKISADQSGGDMESVFCPGEYIESVLKALKHEYKNKNYVFKVNCDESLRIKSFPGAWSQILTNFIMNSLKHGFEERSYGEVNISCKHTGDTFYMVYEDDGRGMTEDVVKRIFDPFFTTNRGKGGTGLGMNIVYNIVTAKLGGNIECESAVNKGTKFIISVPMNKEK